MAAAGPIAQIKGQLLVPGEGISQSGGAGLKRTHGPEVRGRKAVIIGNIKGGNGLCAQGMGARGWGTRSCQRGINGRCLRNHLSQGAGLGGARALAHRRPALGVAAVGCCVKWCGLATARWGYG